VAFLIIIIILLRTNNIRNRNKVLRQLVSQRTNELVNANHELEQKTDHLAEQREELAAQNQMLQDAFNRLRESQAQLLQAEKMASLGQLTAGIAHEINNPINYVNSGIGIIKDITSHFDKILSEYNKIDPANVAEDFNKINSMHKSMLLEEKQHELQTLFEVVQNGIDRVTKIVGGLQQFSRKSKGELKRVNINEVLEQNLLLLSYDLKDRVEISTNLDQDLPTILCDPLEIGQVFFNILLNGAQAIDGHGKIMIQTSTTDHHIFVRIQDTGRGIPKEFISKTFDPFFTTKEVGKGTGLGLSISLSIIKRLNGEINVESESGRGSKFTVKLPIYDGVA